MEEAALIVNSIETLSITVLVGAVLISIMIITN